MRMRGLFTKEATLTNSDQMSVPQIFSKSAKLMQKQRQILNNLDLNLKSDYLKDCVAERLVDRFLDIKRKFKNVLDLGAGCGHLIKHFANTDVGVEKLVQYEESRAMLFRDAQKEYPGVNVERIVGGLDVVDLPGDTYDAVVSNLALHWVNDLPGTLIQAQKVLKPDGVFIGSILGGDTLYELRTAFQLAEVERDGGVSPHISPMVQHQEIGSLLSRANFTLTTVDVDEITINYPSVFELMADLRAMGESNATIGRKASITKDLLMAVNESYKAIYGKTNEKDGSLYIPATFQIIYMIGWKPHESQPKPLKRGSAKHSLKEVFIFNNMDSIKSL